MLFPVMWAEEYASVDDENISTLKSKLLTPLKIIKIGKWAGIAIGIILTVIGIGIFYRNTRN